jgi:asparagine synthetase B (glutamine-hydrolysing)
VWIKFVNKSLVEFSLDDCPVVQKESISDVGSFSEFPGDEPRVIKDSGEYVGLIMPAAPSREIYRYRNDNGDVIYTDGFFDLLEKVSVLNESESSANFFLKKNIFPPGETLYKEICRLLPGRIYFFGQGGGYTELSDSASDKCSVSFEGFERLFDQVVKQRVENKDVGVLLSSGLDSTAVILSAAKCTNSIKTFTMGYVPQIKGVAADIVGAEHTARYLGVSHKVIEVDVASYDIVSLAKFVRRMPMSAGLPVGYERLLKTMSEESISVALTGQNADLLYNLSATDRPGFNRAGMTALFRRWFLTDSYFRYLDYNEKTSLFSGACHAFLERAGSTLYSHFKGASYHPPKDCQQLYQSFINSADVVVFKKNKEEYTSSSKVINSKNLYKMLVRNKLEQDMMLCDSQMIRRTAEHNEVEVFFPFSDGNMIDFWFRKNMTYKDVVYPKRYIRQYVEKNFPSYSERDRLSLQNKSGFDAHAWARKVLTTDFGRQLKEASCSEPVENVTSYKYLMYQIAAFWLNEIRRIRHLYE